MSDTGRKANIAMEQIIGNVTSAMHNSDGQYVQLGFTPPSTPSDQHLWNSESPLPKPAYLPHYNAMHGVEQHPVYQGSQQLPSYNQQSVPYNYLPQPNLYGSDIYDKHPNNYVMYQQQNQNLQSKMCMQDLPSNYQSDYRLFVPQNAHGINHNLSSSDNHFMQNRQENGVAPGNHMLNGAHCVPNPTQIIENVVGNWVPNINGTYSPFGNVQSSKQNVGNIFEMQSNVDNFANLGSQILDDSIPIHENAERRSEMPSFHFNRDTKKPRMVAEVKPMRPTYSDVLTKSPPQTVTKIGKPDTKEAKLKKENGKKSSKNDKTQKLNLNRINSSNDIKIDKNLPNSKSNEKNIKDNKTNQLNRKWASLDNINESPQGFKDESDLTDSRKGKRNDDSNASNKNVLKGNQRKSGRSIGEELEDSDVGNAKNDTLNISKGSVKKGSKFTTKQRNSDAFGNSDKPPGKRGQRIRKRENHMPFGIIGQKLKQYVPGWWKFLMSLCLWLVHLISDICSLSIHLTRDMVCNTWNWISDKGGIFLDAITTVLSRVGFLTRIWEKVKRKKDEEENGHSFLHAGLQHNINMPTTGEEAMKRLLACKGKDPYSILGVTPTCTDDDIKRYYKRQAFLVHPDKNQQPGAEEAFKILVHAFDMIGEPERRAAYDRGVAESAQVEQAWSELTELLAQLQQKVEAAANTIRCSACGLRHKRLKIDRPSYAARNCTQCKIHHSAREGDIWAEARCFGFLWHYYACMEGGVYDITEWASCQKESLKHLRPDSHHVQYRIALGKQNGQSRRHCASPRNERPPDLENLLSSLYGQRDSSQNTRRRNRKANK